MAAKTPPDPPADPPETGAEADRIRQLEEHQAATDTTLAEHGGMLQKIFDKLPGGDPPKGDGPGPAQPGQGQPADIQAAVRAEIAATKQRVLTLLARFPLPYKL